VKDAVRQEVLGFLATPLATATATKELGATQLTDHLSALSWWLEQALALSPSLHAGPPTQSPPDLLRLSLLAPFNATVCFVLASGRTTEVLSGVVTGEVLADHDEDLVVLVLCADVTNETTREAVNACLQAASRAHEHRLLVMEPTWSAGVLVQRTMPLMPGDINLVSRRAPITHFDG
jgi:hypothetical protein